MNLNQPQNPFPSAVAILTVIFLLGCRQAKDNMRADQRMQEITCVNNLKQIGLAFRIWSGDNNNQYPFNLSTNRGGTMELCALGKDGFDRSSFLHFQVMSNELGNFMILICPQDRSKSVATSWQNLCQTNVTYLLRSGPNMTNNRANEILAVCPIDGNVLYCDGHVDEHKVK